MYDIVAKQSGRDPPVTLTWRWRIVTWGLVWWNLVAFGNVLCTWLLGNGEWKMVFNEKKTQGEKWLSWGITIMKNPEDFVSYYWEKIYCQEADGLDVWLPYFRTHSLSCLLVWINQLCLQTLIEQHKDTGENWSYGPWALLAGETLCNKVDNKMFYIFEICNP